MDQMSFSVTQPPVSTHWKKHQCAQYNFDYIIAVCNGEYVIAYLVYLYML